ncbi:MAG: Acyl-CoA dehydrogenase [Alphaproteobacteria bacterium MarineAlpha9_Bin4]|nr:acyl-CoA dehydrogenase [Pelagibacterales bacterium]PPR26991.1 MAG: Acyl-CoA dehydrogenase [Alphaproteobacteria bacterium MarineAlpha9_Bin4]
MLLDKYKDLNEDQRAIIESTSQFAFENITPNALKWDKECFFPKKIYKKAGDLGLAGIYVSEKDGGLGLSRLDASLIFEELAYACPSTSAFLTIHNMAAWMLSNFGNKQIKEKYLSKIINMDSIASYCLTEAGSGSDAAAMKTKAKHHKDNISYDINGSKSFISGAGESDVYFVMLKTEESLKDGISCIIVDKNNDGISFGKNEEKMGWKNQPTKTVSFDNCIVPISNLVGSKGEGFKIAMQGLDGGRINIASCSLGAARFCIDKSINYANERKQFGKYLKEFQDIQFKIADMVTEYKAARLMVNKAAVSLENKDSDSTVYSAMAKRFVTDACFKICNQALQIHGGYGYLSDFGIEKMVRDCRVHQILEGTNEVMRLIISRKILGRHENE